MKTMVIDIEVLQGDGFPHPEKADRPVICLTLYDYLTDQYYTIVQKDDFDLKVEQKEDNWKIAYVKNEEQLFKLFLKVFNKLDPDIITGWNVFFDMAYMINRARKTKYIDIDEISPIQRVRIDWNRKEVEIGGRHVFDMQIGYRVLKKLPSYTLDYVARTEGLTHKTEEAKDIPMLYQEDINRLLVYNKTDVQIVKEIDEKAVSGGLLNFFLDQKRYVGINDLAKVVAKKGSTWSLSVSNLLDTLSLRFAKMEGKVLPNKPKDNEVDDFEGGYCYMCEAGVYENVVCLDFGKQYPMIILTFNLSPETYEKNTNEEGLVPKMLNFLLKQRKKVDAELEKADPATEEYKALTMKKQTIKGLVNGVYGYISFTSSRLFRLEVASKVTAIGRECILYVKDLIEREYGYPIIHVDTDGMKIWVKDVSDLDKLIEIGKKLESDLNDKLKQYIAKKYNIPVDRVKIHLEFEEVIKSFLSTGVKKRYACLVIYEGGKKTEKYEIKGFDTVRTDTPEVLRDVQENVLKMILQGKPKSEIMNYVKEIYNNIRNNKYSPYDLGIPKGISKPIESYGGWSKDGRKISIPIHIRAAIWSNKYLGTSFNEGDKIKILYVKRVEGYPQTDVIAFTDDMKLPEVVIDTQKYIDWLRSKTEKILNVIGIHWAQIEGSRSLLDLLKMG